jgi:hypothetical protein
MSPNPPASSPKFCSECGTRLREDARFCHECGATIDGRRRAQGTAAAPVAANVEGDGTSKLPPWWITGVALVAVVLLSIWKSGQTQTADSAAGTPLGMRSGAAPDLSAMSAEEQADRLFNRVMRLSSEGKADSAAFFSSMALGAIENLQPLDAHRRYDLGLVALVAGDAARARAQADTILSQRGTHLLGLSLAARAADARGDAAAARAFRRRLLAAEASELAAGLQEYADHDADVRAAIEQARRNAP